MMFFAGRFQDKIGARKGVTISGLITGVSFLLCALHPTPLSLTFFFGILYGTGAAFGYASVTPVAMKWFPPEKRGMVTGLVVMSLGAGSLFWPPLLNFLIETFGIIRTFLLWGLLLLAGILSMSRLISEPNDSLPEKEAGSSAARLELKKFISQPIFILLWLMMGLSCGTGLMVVGHLVQIARVNFHMEVGYLLVSFFALFNTLGRFCSGLITDRIGYYRATFVAFLLTLCSMLLYLGGGGLLALLPGTILLAFSYGSLYTSFPAAVAELFGLQDFGAFYGLLFTSVGIGGSLGPFLAGYLADIYGNYNMTFVLGIAASLGALFFALVLKNVLRKKQQLHLQEYI
jgi:OFA family oxalate/formate antiporter-like MFS transporter